LDSLCQLISGAWRFWLTPRKAVRTGSREGRCLLADYKDCTGSTNVHDHYHGHAAYTRLNAMLFDTAEIAKAFYCGR
jgi:hypothetical protein